MTVAPLGRRGECGECGRALQVPALGLQDFECDRAQRWIGDLRCAALPVGELVADQGVDV